MKVPRKIKELGLFDKEHIQFSLETKCPDTAQKLASLARDYVQSYWADLIENGPDEGEIRLQRAVMRVKLHGMRYKPVNILADDDVEQIVRRVEKAAENPDNKEHVAAFLGGAGAPELLLSEALEKFWQYAAPKIQGKNPEQVRVWENSRRRAISNLIDVVGDKRVTELARADMLSFRDWWLERIEAEGLSNNTANHDLKFVRTVLKTVNTNFEPKLGLRINDLFEDLKLESEESERVPYTVNFVRNVLMSRAKLSGMSEDYRLIVWAFANTGAGPRELIMRQPEDIVLDHDVPHIKIVRRKNDGLKTKSRPREIPLVGASLYAFQQRPAGFSQYQDRVNSVTTAIGKFLRENKLYEREGQTLYSLRHTFQDQLTAMNVPDRVQCELMGHAFDREKYGEGPTLAHKQKILRRMAFEVID
ncbi:MAG: hypothetical protein IT557_17375 [Alphaproteobacteria bacterium]|nr:hypothetical protein [Alphaproteobacteria bacterium]